MSKWIAEFELEDGDTMPEHMDLNYKGVKIDFHCKPLEQEPRWIPVSERLPEDSGEYLVTVVDKEDEDYKQIGVAWFAHPKDYDIKDGEWRELMIDEKVIAWMPLPEPFEPQESEVEE